jgi:hypothetical protein
MAAAELARRYHRGIEIAVVCVALLWHLGGAGPQLKLHLDTYTVPGAHVAGWLLLLVIMVRASMSLLRGRNAAVTVLPLAAGALALCAVVTAMLPGARLLETDWVWGSVGWTGVVLLLRRPLRELAGFMAVAAAITLAFLSADGLSRADLAAYVTVLYGGVSVQLAAALTARALVVPARQAARAALAAATADTERMISEQLRAIRFDRYEAVRGTVEPLLKGLVDGTLNPADPAVHRQFLTAVARLRRMLAEHDASDDPLLHDLRVCAEEATRHGIAVDLEVVGSTPPVPAAIRRELTDPVIEVLAAAGSRARITLISEPGSVAVGVVSDTPVEPVPRYGQVTVESQRDGTDLWMETQWQLR